MYEYRRGDTVFADYPEGGMPLLCKVTNVMKDGCARCMVINGEWWIIFDEAGNTVGAHPWCHEGVYNAVVKLHRDLQGRDYYEEKISHALEILKGR